MLKEIVIRNVLEKDPGSFDVNRELTKEEVDKVAGFIYCLKLQRKTEKEKKEEKELKPSSHIHLKKHDGKNERSA